MNRENCWVIQRDLASTSKYLATAIFVFGAFVAGNLSAQDLRTQCGSSNIKSHVESIDAASHSYSVHMGGKIDGVMTRDPIGYWAYDQYWEPNISLRLENVGDTPIVNPWIQRKGMIDSRTLKSIVDSIIKPEMSDKEKARRIYEFEINNRYHATTQDEEVQDVVKRVNVYGYSLCYDESKDISDLWRAAGLKVRQGFPTGHSLAEVFYDGDWHELDSDEHITALLRDNETIASEAEIVADHDLGKRVHDYGILANDNKLGDEFGAMLLYWEGERSGEQPSMTKHTMDFTLRPGESITWAWNPANRYHAKPFSFGDEDADGWNKHWRVMAHAMDGEMTYAPDLSKDSTLQYLKLNGVEKKSTGEFGSGLYLQSVNGTVDVPVKSAYPVVGGRVDLDFARQDFENEGVAISLSFDQGKHWINVQASTPGDYSRMYADLDPFFKKTDDAHYDYILRLTLSSKASLTHLALKGVYLRSTVEMAQLAMPELVLGDNQFTYSDANTDARKVKITQIWDECDADLAIPSAPIAVSPEDGKTTLGTKVKFDWQPGAGVAADNYEFELSEFPDMRWALNSNFHKLISRTAERGTATYLTPAVGLLNPGQTYYWRVRARSKDHLWGDWSKVSSFSALAPAVPVNVAVQFDQEKRSVQLTWKAGKDGTEPKKFRIYGSEERGFSAHSSPYQLNAGLDGTRVAPSNLLLDTPGTDLSVQIPQALWRPYYRVVAVDQEGHESESSAMAELQHPLILTSKLPAAHGRNFYQAQIQTSASIGQYISADEDGKSYQARLRGGDDLVFDLFDAPAGLTIDNKGLISGFIESAIKEEYQVKVIVKNRTTGAEDAVLIPLHVDAEK